MKKILLKIALILTLCVTFIIPVCAEGAGHTVLKTIEACTINGNFNSITVGDRIYMPLNAQRAYMSSDGDVEQLSYTFDDNFAEQLYDDVSISVYEDADYILEVKLYYITGGYTLMYFADNLHYDAISDFLSGNTMGGFLTESYYGDKLEIGYSDLMAWLDPANLIQSPASMLNGLDCYSIYESYNGVFLKETGMIYRAWGNDEVDTYYLIDYSEYDRSYFYADGSFALDSDVIANIYKLPDTALAEQLTAHYDAAPGDDLDWIVNESNTAISVTMAVVVFGVIPLMLIALSVFFLIRKPRRPYRNCLLVLLGFSTVLLVCFVIFCVILIRIEVPAI